MQGNGERGRIGKVVGKKMGRRMGEANGNGKEDRGKGSGME